MESRNRVLGLSAWVLAGALLGGWLLRDSATDPATRAHGSAARNGTEVAPEPGAPGIPPAEEETPPEGNAPSASGAATAADEDVQPSPLRSVLLLGRVLDAGTAAPIPGARVQPAGSAGELSCDDGGRFELPCPLDRVTTFAIEAPGYLTLHASAAPESPPSSESSYALQPACEAWIQVVDEASGRPVRNARLEIQLGRNASAHTDADGYVRTSLAEGIAHRVVASASGYARLVWTFEAVGLDPSVAIRLPLRELAHVRGRVTDAGGRPVRRPRAWVIEDEHEPHRLSPDALSTHRIPGEAQLRAPSRTGAGMDRAGEFHLSLVPCSHPYFVWVGGESLAAPEGGYVSREVGPLELRSPREVRRIEVALERGASIEVRLFADGRELSARRTGELLVVFEAAGGQTVAGDPTGAGPVWIEGAPPGRGTLRVLDPASGLPVEGYLPRELEVLAGERASVDLHR